jgi:hypothetical protein
MPPEASLRHRIGFMGEIVVARRLTDRRGRKFSLRGNQP